MPGKIYLLLRTPAIFFVATLACFAPQGSSAEEKPLEEQVQERAAKALGAAQNLRSELDKALQSGDYDKANKIREELIVTHRERRYQSIKDLNELKQSGKQALPGDFSRIEPVFEEKPKKPFDSGAEPAKIQQEKPKTNRTVITEITDKKEDVAGKKKEAGTREQPARKPVLKEEPETAGDQNIGMPPGDETMPVPPVMNEPVSLQETAPASTKTVITELSGEPVEAQNTASSP